MIDGKETKYYRYPIRTFDFTDLDGKEKWTAHRFTKNVYDIWMPKHFKRICSVIDELPPDINFEVSELQPSEASGLSQGAPLGFVLFVGFATLAVLLFFTTMIGKRRNWARITFLVLFIIGVPFSILPLLQSLAKTPISGILGIAQAVLQVVALVFLFQGISSEWFRSPKKPQ